MSPDTRRRPDRRAPKSWGREILSFAALGGIAAAFFTCFLALARTGLMRDRQFEYMTADPILAGILAAVVSLTWSVYVTTRESRSIASLGGRLPSLSAAGTVAGAAMATVVMMVWPWLLTPPVPDGIVAAEVGRSPAATLAVLLLLTAANGWFLAITLLLVSWPYLGWSITAVLGVVFAFIVAIFAAGFAAIVTFQNPAGGLGILGLACAAASGVGIAGAVGWWVSRSAITREQGR